MISRESEYCQMRVRDLKEFLENECSDNDVVIAICKFDNALDTNNGSEVECLARITQDEDEPMLFLRY